MEENSKNNYLSLKEDIDLGLFKRVILRSKYLILIALIAPLISIIFTSNNKETFIKANYEITFNKRSYQSSNIDSYENNRLLNISNQCSVYTSSDFFQKIISNSYFSAQFKDFINDNKYLKNIDFDNEDGLNLMLYGNLTFISVNGVNTLKFVGEKDKVLYISDKYIDFVNKLINSYNTSCLQKLIDKYKLVLDEEKNKIKSALSLQINKNIQYLNSEKNKSFEYISVFNKKITQEEKNYQNSYLIMFTSFFILYILIITKETFLGFVNEKQMFKDKLKIKFLDTIYSNNKKLTNEILKKYINDFLKDNPNKKISIYLLEDEFTKKEPFKIDDNYHEFNYIDIKNIDDVNKTDLILIFAENMRIKKSNIKEIDIYLKLFSNKILGFFYIEKFKRF
tara:strand:+ start:280 stop:1464 length:1185 start_codon:yes stop_codon:yes gene_type:complete